MVAHIIEKHQRRVSALMLFDNVSDKLNFPPSSQATPQCGSHLILQNGTVGEVYNIGGHNEMKNIDIVKFICEYLQKPESLIEHVQDRQGHDMRYAIDPTKIHDELGWLPETMFKDGIRLTIQWYLDNRKWWENIVNGEYQNYYNEMYGKRVCKRKGYK